MAKTTESRTYNIVLNGATGKTEKITIKDANLDNYDSSTYKTRVDAIVAKAMTGLESDSSTTVVQVAGIENVVGIKDAYTEVTTRNYLYDDGELV